MRIEEIEEKLIYGISTRTRTSNANEMHPKTAKIGAIWEAFDERVDVDYRSGERVYGVYYDYESDASGAFKVLAGSEIADEQLDAVKIAKGRYLVFSKTFEQSDNHTRVQAIITTWGEVWNYFSDEHSQYKRSFNTDFEFYKGRNEIEIYISID